MQYNCRFDDLRAGFEIAEGYRLRHGKMAKPIIDFRQDALF